MSNPMRCTKSDEQYWLLSILETDFSSLKKSDGHYFKYSFMAE